MKEIVHDSDCAVNNEPACSAGPCDCGALAKHEHRYATYLYQKGCNLLAHRRNALRFWIATRFCRAKTGASQKHFLSCYRLLFGKRELRGAWYAYRRAQMVLPLWKTIVRERDYFFILDSIFQ